MRVPSLPRSHDHNLLFGRLCRFRAILSHVLFFERLVQSVAMSSGVALINILTPCFPALKLIHNYDYGIGERLHQ